MEAPIGTADTPQELRDIVDDALIQGGGWATMTFTRDVARRNATDTIQVWATGTESGPGGVILEAAEGDTDESPGAAPLTSEAQNGTEHTPTRRYAHTRVCGE